MCMERFTHSVELDLRISFAPLNSRRIWTISQFVFNGNSCPVRLMKYFHRGRLSSSLIHVIWGWRTENRPHSTSCRISGMNTLGKQFAMDCTLLNVVAGVCKSKCIGLRKVIVTNNHHPATQIWVNTGLDNCLLPASTKPLPDLLRIYQHWCSLALN